MEDKRIELKKALLEKAKELSERAEGYARIQ